MNQLVPSKINEEKPRDYAQMDHLGQVYIAVIRVSSGTGQHCEKEKDKAPFPWELKW